MELLEAHPDPSARLIVGLPALPLPGARAVSLPSPAPVRPQDPSLPFSCSIAVEPRATRRPERENVAVLLGVCGM